MNTPRRSAALVALVVTIIAWAAVPLVLRYFALHHLLDAWTVNGIRYFFTVLFWMPYLAATYRKIPRRQAIWKSAAVPAACHCLGQIGWGLAPYFNSASVMNFVSRVGFLFTILAGFWLLREERAKARLPLFWVGVAGTVMGVLAMFGGGIDIGNTSLAGMTLLVITSVCWALYGVNVSRTMQGYGARAGYAVVSLYVAPVLMTLMFTIGDWRAALELSAPQWVMLALSGLVGLALGHVTYYFTVRELGPILAEGGLAVVPFVTALAAHALLDESMRPSQWIGGTALVISSLILLRIKAPARVAIENPPGG